MPTILQHSPMRRIRVRMSSKIVKKIDTTSEQCLTIRSHTHTAINSIGYHAIPKWKNIIFTTVEIPFRSTRSIFLWAFDIESIVTAFNFWRRSIQFIHRRIWDSQFHCAPKYFFSNCFIALGRLTCTSNNSFPFFPFAAPSEGIHAFGNNGTWILYSILNFLLFHSCQPHYIRIDLAILASIVCAATFFYLDFAPLGISLIDSLFRHGRNSQWYLLVW